MERSLGYFLSAGQANRGAYYPMHSSSIRPGKESDFSSEPIGVTVVHSARDLIGEYGIFQKSAKQPLREPRYQAIAVGHDTDRIELYDPSDRWEKGSEILFGQVYQVLDISQDRHWMKIKVGGFDTVGWLEIHHHTPCSGSEFEVLAHKPHPMLASRTGLLESLSPGDRQVPIFLGASLPRFDRHGEIEVGGERFKLVEGEPVPTWLPPRVGNLLAILHETLGAPYEWGGKGGAYDCSGLLSVAFSFFGLKLPHSARAQSTQGEGLQSVGDLQTGDVIAYGDEANPGSVKHIGIALVDGAERKLLHASQRVRVNPLDGDGQYHRPLNRAVRALRRLIDFTGA
jgi:hypothetical protein